MTTPDDFNYGYHGNLDDHIQILHFEGGVWTDTSGDTDRSLMLLFICNFKTVIILWKSLVGVLKTEKSFGGFEIVGVVIGALMAGRKTLFDSPYILCCRFKLERGINNMLIEDQCAAAVVDVRELDELLSGSKIGSLFGHISSHNLCGCYFTTSNRIHPFLLFDWYLGVIPANQTPQLLPPHWQHMKDHKWKPSKAAALKQEKQLEQEIQAKTSQKLDSGDGNSSSHITALTSANLSTTTSSNSGILCFLIGVAFTTFLFILLQKRKEIFSEYTSI